jgi:transposase
MDRSKERRAAGAVNRLKNIKRQIYGRASFELLRKRVILMGIFNFHQM